MLRLWYTRDNSKGRNQNQWTSRQCWQNQGPRQNREFMQQVRNRESREPWVFKVGGEGSLRGWKNSLSHSNIAVHTLNRASVALVLGGEVAGSVAEWSCLWGKSWASTTLDSESSQERRRMGWNCLLVGCVKALWSSPGNLESINWMYTMNSRLCYILWGTHFGVLNGTNWIP